MPLQTKALWVNTTLPISYADYSQSKKPIIPIGGEMFCSRAAEMNQLGAFITARGITEGHFYTSAPNIKPDMHAAKKAL